MFTIQHAPPPALVAPVVPSAEQDGAGRPESAGGDRMDASRERELKRFQDEANFYRFDEDYRDLRNRRSRFLPLVLKEIPVARDTWLSLGGDYRLRVDNYSSPQFGLPGPPSFTSVQNRFLVHANAEFGSTVRAFLQLGVGTEMGREPGPRPGDRSSPDVAQAFLDYSPTLGTFKPKVRVGRQEFVLGRYVSIREATNFRRAFDGIRLDIAPGKWTMTAFAGQEVTNRKNAFDDTSGREDQVAVFTADHPLGAGLRLQGTFIDRRAEGATFLQASGLEKRRTYSARLSGGTAPWKVDVEATYQNGSLKDATGRRYGISAWGLAVEAEVKLPGSLSPQLGLRIDTASGDRDPNDGRIGTFDIPYPNLAYLTDATIFAPRNNRDIQPYITFKPAPGLNVTIGDQLLWRNRRTDAIYNPANLPIAPQGGRGSLIANQPYLRTTFQASALLNLQASYVHAFRGDVLRSSGATRDLDFLYGALLFRF